MYSIIDAHLLIGMNVINEISRKYGGFLIPMIKNGEKLKNSINQDKGLVLMAKKSKWAFLDWDESGEPRTYDEAIQEAIKILNNDILTESYRHLNKIGKGYAPSREALQKEFGGFVKALGRRRLKYEDILKKAGLGKKKSVKTSKWAFLDIDKNGIALSKKKRLEFIFQ